MLYKYQDYVNFDQFVSCFVMVSVNNGITHLFFLSFLYFSIFILKFQLLAND